MLLGCEKGFLETKPNKRLLVPYAATDLQTILDNISIMNNYMALASFSADEFVLADNSLERVNDYIATAYLWLRDNYKGAGLGEWTSIYQQIFYSNIVLDAIENLPANNIEKRSQLQGSALFYRAMGMYQVSQLFAKPYSTENLNALGVPYPLESDVNIRPGRGTVKQVYEQLLQDLIQAEKLLPNMADTKNRPGKQACDALLARIYLIMGDYTNALLYANKTLTINNQLLDYNSGKAGSLPFASVLPNGNEEVIFYQRRFNFSIFTLSVCKLETEFDKSFAVNDLRKVHSFTDRGNGFVSFKGYEGLTTSEAYLIKAECLARLGDRDEALKVLNQLCITRFITGTYIPYAVNTTDEALQIIISERRKDLFGRGLRWTDLRRLGRDPKLAVTLKRIYNGTEYTLLPNGDGYVFKIPDNEVLVSGIQQN